MTPTFVVSMVPLVTFVDMSTNISIPAAFIHNYHCGKPTTKPKGKKTSSASRHFIHHHAVKASRTSLPAPAYKAHHYKGSTKVTITAVPQKWAAGHLEGTTKVLLYRTPAEEVTLSPTSTSTAPKAVYKGTHLGGTRVRLTPSQWAASHLGGTKVRLSLAPISGACPPAITKVSSAPSPKSICTTPKAVYKGTHLGGTRVRLTPSQWAASHLGGSKVRLSLAPISGACPPAITKVVPNISLAPPALPATLEWSAAHLGGTKVLLQRPGPPMVNAWEKMDEKTLAAATQAPERWAASHVGGTRLRLSRTAL